MKSPPAELLTLTRFWIGRGVSGQWIIFTSKTLVKICLLRCHQFCNLLYTSGIRFLSIYLILEAAEECESLAVLFYSLLGDWGRIKTYSAIPSRKQSQTSAQIPSHISVHLSKKLRCTKSGFWLLIFTSVLLVKNHSWCSKLKNATLYFYLRLRPEERYRPFTFEI